MASPATATDLSDKELRDRSIRLFTFLRELMELRSKTVRSIGQYEKVIWVADIPKHSNCYCAAWDMGAEHPGDCWIQIRRPKLQDVPTPPPALERWLTPEFRDPSIEMPQLTQAIPIDSNQEQGTNVQQVFIPLSDRPDVRHLFEEYVAMKWIPWATVERENRRIMAVYTDLFSIYQHQQRLGEAYEVVFALGLLVWNTPDGQLIQRHLITAQTSLAFDPVRGLITLGPAGEGARPQLEQDMLEPQQRPDATEQKAIEQLISDMGDQLWDGSYAFSAMEAWAHAVTPSGDFLPELQPQLNAGERPRVTFAPAVILRKRTERSFVRMFKDIAEQIERGGDIPVGIRRIISILDDANDKNGNDLGSQTRCSTEDSEIYFPDLANEEQLAIVRKLFERQGVLVQGPPGTGKSHTIANLVAHLLANGQRVLVTSHTARALKVLKDKLAEQVSQLCVLVLGDDLSAMQSLEDSVRGINDRFDRWNEDENKEHIKHLHEKLDSARRAEARTAYELRAIREAQTFKHENVCGGYSGTTQQIAQRVNQEQVSFGWIDCTVAPELDPPLSNEEVVEFLNLSRVLSKPENISQLQARSVECSFLATPEDFARLVSTEREKKKICDGFRNVRSDPSLPLFQRISQEERQRVIEVLESFVAHVETVGRDLPEWAANALSEILSGNDLPWRELVALSERAFNTVGPRVRAASDLRVSGIEGRDYLEVQADTRNLLSHFRSGGRLGFGPFRSKVVKQGRYLIDGVRVDGQRCNTEDALAKLLNWLEVNSAISRLKTHWRGFIQVKSESLAIQFAEYQSACKLIVGLLAFIADLECVRKALRNVQIAEPNWSDVSQAQRIVRILNAISADEEYRNANGPLRVIEQRLATEVLYRDTHPTIAQTSDAVTKRCETDYAIHYQALQQWETLRQSRSKFLGIRERLASSCPSLLSRIEETRDDLKWDSRLSEFVLAWNWARCCQFLANLGRGATVEKLSFECEASRSRIRHTLRDIGAAKAWAHCFSRLEEEQRQHLRAWARAVRRIGRGTGKYANLHRKEARTHMEHCRSAIPAWVMPTYRVAESLKATPGAFDVVIIDEASQSGPEALFLFYIGKKIVVVGDDKQISPDFVGINRADVELLRQRRIPDLPHADALGVDDSFFSIAEIRYSGRIRLREHFRCMPEIIQFSNNLCYSTEPLIPLRQYGLSRLTPIVRTMHVPDGYQKGVSPRIVNPPEAAAIAERITGCCNDSTYKGKSFGVISLLGEDQAREINKRLLESIGPEEMEKRKLICGDAYAFQGDERDVIFLSLVSAPTEGHRIGTLAAPKDERRFNVAVSRARDQLWLFHTATLNDLSPQCLRYKLLQYCLDPHVEPSELEISKLEALRNAANRGYSDSTPPEPFDSWFETHVFLDIAKKGFRVLPQYKVAGYSIDLVVEGMNGRLAVECDGDCWHGSDNFDHDMARQRQLERCGWTFWRVRGSEYYRDPESALQSLWITLERLRIFPKGEEHSIPVPDIPTVPEVQLHEILETAIADERDVEVDTTLTALEDLPDTTDTADATPISPGTTSSQGLEDESDGSIWAALDRCIPRDGKIERQKLLDSAMKELGHVRLTHSVRSRLNKCISAHVKSSELKVDHNWDHVWRSR